MTSLPLIKQRSILISLAPSPVSTFGQLFGDTQLSENRRAHAILKGTTPEDTKNDLLKDFWAQVIREWFSCWKSWQQRYFIHGVISACSIGHLEALATALEPIFHRDFLMLVKQRFPVLKNQPKTSRRNKQKRKKHTKPDDTLNVIGDDKYTLETQREDQNIDKTVTIDSTLLQHTNIHRKLSPKSFPSSIDEYALQVAQEVVHFGMQQSSPLALPRSATFPSVSAKVTLSESRVKDKARVVPDLMTLVNRSKQRSDLLLYQPVNEGEYQCKQPVQHHNAWARYSVPSNPSSAAERHSGYEKNLRPTPSRKMRLSGVYRELTQTQTYEGRARQQARIFPWKTAEQKKAMIRPPSFFQQQMAQVYQWLRHCHSKDHISILMEVAKLCTHVNINYMAQCLYYRLQENFDINWCPDRVLLWIFSYLSPGDLRTCAQVCRRWRHLTMVDELWITKCSEHASNWGSAEFTAQLAQKALVSDSQVDWKEAYHSLISLPPPVRVTPKPPPRTATPVGKFRQAGKLIDITDEEVPPTARKLASRLVEMSNQLKREWRTTLDINRARQDYNEQDQEIEQIESNHDQTPEHEDNNIRENIITQATSVLTEDLMNMSPETMSPENERPATPESRTLEEWVRHCPIDCGAIAVDARCTLAVAANLIEGNATGEDLIRWGLAGQNLTVKDRKSVVESLRLISVINRVLEFEGDKVQLTKVCMDKRRVFAGRFDGRVQIWDLQTGATIKVLNPHKGAVTCLVYESNTLYTGSWDKSVQVIDLITFDLVATLLGHTDTVSGLVLQKNCLWSSSYDGTVCLWDRTTFTCTRVFTVTPVHYLAMDDQRIYTTGSDRKMRSISQETGEILNVMEQHSEQFTCVMIYGKLIITGNIQGQVWFWRKEVGQPEVAITAHTAPITALKWVKGRLYTAASDCLIKEWNMSLLACVRVFVGHRAPVQDIWVTRNHLASVDKCGGARLWDFHNSGLKTTIPNSNSVITHHLMHVDDVIIAKHRELGQAMYNQ